MTKKIEKTATIFALIFLAAAFRLFGQTPEQWRQDIDTLTYLIEKHHPKPWEKTSRQDFLKQAEEIKANLLHWSAEKTTVELMALVAGLQDGHTELLLNGQQKFNHWFPVRMERFYDGVFMTACEESQPELLGAKILRLGNLGIHDAFKKVARITAKDSKIAASRLITNHFSNAMVLTSLGIISDVNRLDMEIETASGAQKIITLASAPWEMRNNWSWNKTVVPTKNKTANIYDSRQGQISRYLSKMLPSRIPYWFEFYPEEKLLYLQMNSVGNWRKDPLADFTQRLFKKYDENAKAVERFVIDLRFNEGGDGSLLIPFVQEFVLRRDSLPRGKLYIITGSRTFSAASNLIGRMLEQTKVITVGDIAPGPLNWCSDTLDFRLPNSDLIVNISTMFWMKGHAMDKRGFYPPDYFVPETFKDLVSFADRPLEAIQSNQAEPLMDILLNKGWENFRSEFEKRKARDPELDNWFPYTHFDLILAAYFNLLKAGKPDDALELLKLNTVIYPGEYRSWYGLAEVAKDIGQTDVALQAYEKLLALEPQIADLWTSYCGLQLLKRYVESGPDGLAKLFLELKNSHPAVLNEGTLNILGYEMLQKGKTQDAVEIFRINVRLHPGYANGYDSLGEAYLKTGDKKEARKAYEKALKLDPGLSSAKAALEQLK